MSVLSEFPRTRQVQFSALMETGDISEWTSTATSGGAADPVAQQVIVRSGLYALSANLVGNGPYRSEVTASREWCRPLDGSERFYGVSYYFSPGFPSAANGVPGATYQICGQWHHSEDGGAWDASSPPLAFYVNSYSYGMTATDIVLGGGGINPNNYPFWGVSLGATTTGVWIDLVVFVRWSLTPGGGHVTAWRNGVQVADYTPPSSPTVYPVPTRPSVYFKTGYYRDAAITTDATVYADQVRIGGSFAAVDPAGVDPLVGARVT